MRCGGSGRPGTDLPFAFPSPSLPSLWLLAGLLFVSPKPKDGDAGGGGGGGGRSTELRTAPSGRILPPWMKRRRRWELGSVRRARIRCLRDTTVVCAGRGMSSSRSGIAALKRMVRRRGCGCGCGCGCEGTGGLRYGGGDLVVILRGEVSLSPPVRMMGCW